MLIDDKTCIGCGKCMPYCPVGAIVVTDKKTAKGKEIRAVDLDPCVECGTCLRARICPVDAISQQPLEWPRTLRAAFSNPLTEHKSTGHMGRGTEEMKTNEVTGRFVHGQVGIAVEMGRPGIGSTLKEIDLMTRELAKWGVEFEPNTPVTGIMSDRTRGTLPPEVLCERVLSAIVEFKIPTEKLENLLPAIDRIARTLETVFTLGIISVLPSDGPDPLPEMVRKIGFELRPNGKVNLGLGRAVP
jgi:NAD-dependent dihydropyrimidine dehydrogenase PreA subunit